MSPSTAEEPLFPPGSVIRRVDGENVLLLGGGRALLMQLAHPLVAQGVAEHSGFQSDPIQRLRRTLDASYAMVFGSRAEADRVATRIRGVHGRVRGAGYDANDPELLMWVHATLVDSALRVHRRFLGRLSPTEEEEYYQESTVLAVLLGVPRHHQPIDFAAFRSYVRSMVGTLEVSDTARELARAVLHPRLPRPAEPAVELGRQLTAGLLPRPLREQYGLGWDRPRETLLQAVGAASRTVLPRLPGVIRRACIASRAAA